LKRVLCTTCNYPLATCVCEHISQVDLPAEIIILQHPKEAVHAKNTARLLSLVSPEIKVINTGQDHLLNELNHRIDKEAALVFYPSNESKGFEGEFVSDPIQPKHLIFIDASWRQAYGIWKSHSWLSECKNVHFTHPPASQYLIRSAKLQHQLSTLESVAYSLNCLYQTPVEPFYQALAGFQKHWLTYS